ncbi:MAG: S-layer protein [uncultured bacterium (gcode 4)]|uniref:S-layer protein n=1 Tax=uncultured bacterium (gcode 4) TaxID=1234023 RepID=K2G564_9BACT|nr:MAG: S-layer protein [uncultured bacterium (gcode 4)]
MKKNILTLLFAASMAIIPSSYAAVPAFPSFPMVIWWNVNISSQPAKAWTSIDFFDQSWRLLTHYVMTRDWVYWWPDSWADLSPTFNDFAWNLTIKISGSSWNFTVSGNDFANTDQGNWCSRAPDIRFTPNLCRYDISVMPVSAIPDRPQQTTTRFSDIGSSFAKDEIIALEKKWLIRWFPDDTFRPNKPITRAEFLAIVINSSEVSVAGNEAYSTYADIPVWWGWMIPYLETWRKFWIKWQAIWWIRIFMPNSPITRAEALAMLFRIGGISATESGNPFADVTVGWQIPYITTASRLWIISWQQISLRKYFRPNDPITRAEAATIIVKASELK